MTANNSETSQDANASPADRSDSRHLQAEQGSSAMHANKCSFPTCKKQKTGRKDYCDSHQKQLTTKGEVREFAYRPWTYEEEAIVRGWYAKFPEDKQCELGALATFLKRTKQTVSRKAGELGLSSRIRMRKADEDKKYKRPKYKTKEERSAASSVRQREWIRLNGHPRGALGMQHTEEAKRTISNKSRARARSRTKTQRQDIAAKSMRTRIANGHPIAPYCKRGRWKAGWRVIGGKKVHCRSAWEANYARFLEFEKTRGNIKEWEHEPETFWFEKIKRGVRSYLPDFRVIKDDGAIEYHEVKGWMDDKSKTKIKRMGIYHPKVKLIVISTPIYKGIEMLVKSAIKDWE